MTDPDFAKALNAVGKKKDKSAFVTLFEHFAPRIKAFLLARGLTSEAADDLAQEVMLTLWHKAPLYNPLRARPSTWIFAIARHKYVDMLRLQTSHSSFVLPLVEEEKTPQEILIASESHEAVESALATLPQELTQILYLSFFEGLSHSAIAARTGLPLGTVKSRIRRALEVLRSKAGLEALWKT